MDVIGGWHAHVYYEAARRPEAEALRARLETLYPAARNGRWRDRPGGPHPSAMFQIAFGTELFADIVPWLLLHRGALTIFLHPDTGRDRTDHERRALWMGPPQPLDLSRLSDAEEP